MSWPVALLVQAPSAAAAQGSELNSSSGGHSVCSSTPPRRAVVQRRREGREAVELCDIHPGVERVARRRGRQGVRAEEAAETADGRAHRARREVEPALQGPAADDDVDVERECADQAPRRRPLCPPEPRTPNDSSSLRSGWPGATPLLSPAVADRVLRPGPGRASRGPVSEELAITRPCPRTGHPWRSPGRGMFLGVDRRTVMG